MNYKKLGKTDISVSEIGLGCEGFLGKDDVFTSELFSVALENGVNCIDMYSPDPDLQRRLGEAVFRKREDFVIQGHICTAWENGQYKAVRDVETVKSAFEIMLENIGTDYIDIGNIHYIDSLGLWRQIEQGGIAEYARKLKEQGKIRAISMSSHNPAAALAAVESGLVDSVLFSVNPYYDLLPGTEDVDSLFTPECSKIPRLNLDPQRERLYEVCLQRGVGITVMKAFGGGDLLSEKNSPAGRALSAVQCIHYALTRPAVVSVMVGAHSADDLKTSLEYETASDAEKDYAAAFAEFPRLSWKGRCMYCGHCAPCPKGIDVASVTKFLYLCRAQDEMPETVREHYAALKAHANECAECGACEKRCPFEVKIIENIRSAKQTFGY